MNFKEYVEQQENLITESTPTVSDLINNFRKVFPYSKDSSVNVKHFSVTGEDTQDLSTKGQVSSEENPGHTYLCTAEFHREDTEIPFSLQNIGKVSCSCNAYRYNLSHPNTKNTVQSKPIPGYANIPNRVHNPDKNTGVCKHLFSFLHYLYNKGIIRNN